MGAHKNKMPTLQDIEKRYNQKVAHARKKIANSTPAEKSRLNERIANALLEIEIINKACIESGIISVIRPWILDSFLKSPQSSSIITKFLNLCEQFINKKKYLFDGNTTISKIYVTKRLKTFFRLHLQLADEIYKTKESILNMNTSDNTDYLTITCEADYDKFHQKLNRAHDRLIQ